MFFLNQLIRKWFLSEDLIYLQHNCSGEGLAQSKLSRPREAKAS
jgi:hypothetical protein